MLQVQPTLWSLFLLSLTFTSALSQPPPSETSLPTPTDYSTTAYSKTTSSSTTNVHPSLPTNLFVPDKCPAAAISAYGGNGTCPCPDVYLNVPDLSVANIELVVDDLVAHVSLNAEVANLVKINAGVDVSIKGVKLQIQGVRAQVLLEARLDNVYRTLSRTLDTLDKNPSILTGLVTAVVDNLDNVLSETTNALGQTVRTVIDATGNIVEQVVGDAGQIVSSNVRKSVLDFPVVKSGRNTLGQVVETRKENGKLIEVTLDSAGKVLSAVLADAGAGADRATRKIEL